MKNVTTVSLYRFLVFVKFSYVFAFLFKLLEHSDVVYSRVLRAPVTTLSSSGHCIRQACRIYSSQCGRSHECILPQRFRVAVAGLDPSCTVINCIRSCQLDTRGPLTAHGRSSLVFSRPTVDELSPSSAAYWQPFQLSQCNPKLRPQPVHHRHLRFVDRFHMNLCAE